MSRSEIARRAARAALHQRGNGDTRGLRELWRRADSLLRWFHHAWASESPLA
jgi:hypothetical protein